MTWTRTSTDTLESAPWLIAKGWWINSVCYRLFRGSRLIAICPSAESAKERAERGGE